MAAADALYRHPSATDRAPFADRIQPVGAARGLVAALPPEEWAERPAIQVDSAEQNILQQTVKHPRIILFASALTDRATQMSASGPFCFSLRGERMIRAAATEDVP